MRRRMLHPGLGALGEGVGGGVFLQLPEYGARFGKCAAPPQRQGLAVPQ